MAKTRTAAPNSGRKAKEPKIGSAEWMAREQEKPGFALAEMKNLSDMIAQGDKWAIKTLEKWMAKFPDVARELAHGRLGDLCASAEAAWLTAVAGDNPLNQMGLKEQIATMKAELQGENPSILEKVLVSSVVVAHLAHYRAVTAAAQPAHHQAVAAFRDRRVGSTARQLLLAVKSLATVRQQQGRGLAPKTKIKLFDGTG